MGRLTTWRRARRYAVRLRIAKALMHDPRRRLTTGELLHAVGEYHQLPWTLTSVLNSLRDSGLIAAWRSSSGTVYWHPTGIGRVAFNRLIMEAFAREQ